MILSRGLRVKGWVCLPFMTALRLRLKVSFLPSLFFANDDDLGQIGPWLVQAGLQHRFQRRQGTLGDDFARTEHGAADVHDKFGGLHCDRNLLEDQLVTILDQKLLLQFRGGEARGGHFSH